MSSRSLIFLLKLLVSGLLIAFLFSKVGLTIVAKRLQDITPSMLLLALGLLVLQSLLAVIRWRTVMKGLGIDIPYFQTLKILFVGLFFNQTLPSSIGGDAMRVWYTRGAGHSLGVASQVVILDRAAGFVAVILIAFVTLPLLSSVIQNPTAFWNICLAIVIATTLIVVFMFLDWQPKVLSNKRIFRFISELSQSARKLFFSLRMSFSILGSSIVIHFFTFFAIFILARGMNIPLAFIQCLVLIPPVLVLSMLPISIAGWGVREGAMVAALGFVHVPQGQSLSLSVIYGLCLAVISLPGGIIWLVARSRQTSSFTRAL